jgi:apolipoprotein D and lipocalin family protein
VDFGIGSPADYWIVDLDSSAGDAPYQWAVVSNESRSTLYILAREPRMDTGFRDALIEDLRTRGYNTSRLKLTRQSGR